MTYPTKDPTLSQLTLVEQTLARNGKPTSAHVVQDAREEIEALRKESQMLDWVLANCDVKWRVPMSSIGDDQMYAPLHGRDEIRVAMSSQQRIRR